MATVIGIFEESIKKGKPLPVVKPGTQSRRFTHLLFGLEKEQKYSLCNHK